MAAQHGRWLPETWAEGQHWRLGLPSEVLTLGAPLQGSMASGRGREGGQLARCECVGCTSVGSRRGPTTWGAHDKEAVTASRQYVSKLEPAEGWGLGAGRLGFGLVDLMSGAGLVALGHARAASQCSDRPQDQD